MKPIIYSLIVLSLFACGDNSSNTFGEKIDTTKAVTVDVALKAFESTGQADAVIKGQISQVCTGEGCWYTLKHGGTEQFVGFEKFTVSKDIAGRQSEAAGRFYRDTQSVEAQREGLSKEEADKITEPKVSVQFKAVGIVVR
ncbi:MAG: DUF4920 domain-containing protein [Bacteroidetes bacterium]|nr:DUF4920 domain-containing protein [Bacteroidota bacterium]